MLETARPPIGRCSWNCTTRKYWHEWLALSVAFSHNSKKKLSFRILARRTWEKSFVSSIRVGSDHPSTPYGTVVCPRKISPWSNVRPKHANEEVQNGWRRWHGSRRNLVRFLQGHVTLVTILRSWHPAVEIVPDFYGTMSPISSFVGFLALLRQIGWSIVVDLPFKGLDQFY